MAASLNFVRSLDPETSGRARIAAIGRLKDAVAPFDPDTLFPDEDHARAEPGAEDRTRHSPTTWPRPYHEGEILPGTSRVV